MRNHHAHRAFGITSAAPQRADDAERALAPVAPQRSGAFLVRSNALTILRAAVGLALFVAALGLNALHRPRLPIAFCQPHQPDSNELSLIRPRCPSGSNYVTQYASYYCGGRPSHFPRTRRLLSPQPSGLRDATSVAAAAALDKGRLGEPFCSATFQEGFKNRKRKLISIAF